MSLRCKTKSVINDRMFGATPALIIAFLDYALCDKNFCLVVLNKQQIN